MLTEILNAARQESAQMRHYYIGVEHLFIAMLNQRGGITSNLIQDHGFKPEYVIDSLRRKMGKGSKTQTVALGLPTPRADRLIESARRLATKSGRTEPNERDLLVSLLRDGDCLPVRLLKALGLSDMDHLLEAAQAYRLHNDSQQPYVSIEFGPDFDRSKELNNEQLLILRRIFHGYLSIRVDRYLTGGYSEATLVVVTPMASDRRPDAPVVIKIDQGDRIQDEYQRYDSHVRTKLPPLTARVEGRPVSSEMSALAGIKYTLVTDTDLKPKDLRAIINQWDGETLGNWLENTLFPAFGNHWWLQNYPYRFQVWQEYDWMLPPILTLELTKEDPHPTSVRIQVPVRRSRLRSLEYGDSVTVENFVVQKVYPARNAILLAAGPGAASMHARMNAYRIEIRNVDLHRNTHFRGEVIDSITGTVYKTRHEMLAHALSALEPYFDIYTSTIHIPGFSPEYLPNPITRYNLLLDDYLNGSRATIHGDLHPGNIMIGPKESAFLIDFAHTREGHTLFDWANLETSLLCDLFIDDLDDTWDSVIDILREIRVLNKSAEGSNGTHPIHPSLKSIAHIRRIAHQILTATNVFSGTQNPWGEYYMALAFCALRAMSRDTLNIPQRRLMALLAALAINDVTGHLPQNIAGKTPTPDGDDTNYI